jgi:hypothetical protein
VDAVPYYLSLGTTQLTQSQGLGERLLGQGLLGEHQGNSVRSFFTLRWIKQSELLYLLQFFEQLLHRDPVPRGLRLLMHVLQQRDAKHAIESIDADLAVGPVMHGPPAQPLSVLESAEDSSDGLLTGISRRYLFRRPVHAIGEQNRAAEAMCQQALPGSDVEVELEMPVTLALLQFVVDYVGQELAGEPALYLAANLLLIPAGFR